MEGMREREVGRKESSMAERNCAGDGSNSRIREEEKGGGLMLFGVRIDGMEALQGETMRKSLSTGNLVSCGEQQKLMADGVDDNGYLSDGIVHSRNRGGHQRKRGIPWTEEEHMTFLAGLEKLGKGDWKGISRKFVTTRTPTQVASHAQKHFLRQACNSNKKKKRSSLFGMAIPDFNAGSSNGVDNKIEAFSESFLALPTVTTHQASELHINAVGGSCGGFEFAHPTLSLAELPDHAKPTPDNGAYQQAYMPYLPQPPLPIPAVSETMCTPSLFTCSSILIPSCIASSTSAETSDLELRIAPPQPFSHRTLPMFFSDYIIRDNIRVP